MNLPQLAKDKANHFIYGQSLFFICYSVIWKITDGYNWAAWSSEVIVILVGGLKEWSDKRANDRAKAAGKPPPHGVEVWDWMATTLGGMSIWVVVKFT